MHTRLCRKSNFFYSLTFPLKGEGFTNAYTSMLSLFISLSLFFAQPFLHPHEVDPFAHFVADAVEVGDFFVA